MARKKYKPKGLRTDNMTWLIAGMRNVADVPEAGNFLMLRNHAAFDELLAGRGKHEHVDTLIQMVNMADALARLQLGRDWLPEIQESQNVIYNLASRGLTIKRFVFYGPEIEVIRQILELHDEQLKNCPVRLMEDALKVVNDEHKHKRMRRIKPMEPA
jgi:hypothetical protein